MMWPALPGMKETGSKYKNEKHVNNGVVFDSIKESNRYTELSLMQRAGLISDLRMQVPYELIPNQYIDGKLVERKIVYLADFVYTDKDGNTIVEDVKGMRTREYKIKRKLLLYIHNIRINEID